MTAVEARPKSAATSLVEFRQTAQQLGQVCFPLHKIRKQLAEAMAKRMCQRVGSFIYQSVAFSVDNFSLQAAEQIFPDHLVTFSNASTKTWRAVTQGQVKEMIGLLLEESTYACVESARALKTKSERVIRLMTQILPPLEVSWVESSDLERMYVNFQYVIVDQDAEVYPPKDGERREILIEAGDEQALRQHLMASVIKMHAKGYPLGPGFLRRMGKTDEAMQVEAMLSNPYNPPLPPSTNGKVRKKVKEGSMMFAIDCIVGEKPSRGKAEKFVLVRWDGYHPSWEAWRTTGDPGTPVESWEPLSTVRQTEAWRAWEAG